MKLSLLSVIATFLAILCIAYADEDGVRGRTDAGVDVEEMKAEADAALAAAKAAEMAAAIEKEKVKRQAQERKEEHINQKKKEHLSILEELEVMKYEIEHAHKSHKKHERTLDELKRGQKILSHDEAIAIKAEEQMRMDTFARKSQLETRAAKLQEEIEAASFREDL